MKKVFVAVETFVDGAADELVDWIFDHWDEDKTKIILTCINDNEKFGLITEAQHNWPQRCRQTKFGALILIPEKEDFNGKMFELITKHGMKTLVIDASWKSDISKYFDDRWNLSCKVWYLDLDGTSWAKEPSVRGYGPNYDDLHTKKTEYYMKMSEEETTRREQAEKNLHSMMNELNNAKYKYMKIAEDEYTRWEQAEEKVLSMTEELLKLQAEHSVALNEVKELRKQREVVQNSDFTLEELKEATDNFSDSLKISKGAYGCVYKGYIRGIHVAVKILNAQSSELISAFKQEVAILTTARHPNLVTLIGACYEASALVYEFLPNGSLENHLNHSNNTIPLTWQLRTRIICEICLALIFLHSNKPNMVIHGDLKPDNVLLDANFVSKLGDFGISRLIQQSDTNATVFHLTYNPVGTPGYMDPDYVYTGKLTEKSDVFSLGVIILRLLTGEPANGIVFRVQKAMENETLHKMMDVSAGKWPFDQAKELASLALRCVEMKRSDRPNLFNEVWPIVERLRRNL